MTKMEKPTYEDLEKRCRALERANAELEKRVEERTEAFIRTHKVLHDSEEWLRVLFEEAPDGIYLHDLKGKFLDGNRAAETLIGYKREEMAG